MQKKEKTLMQQPCGIDVEITRLDIASRILTAYFSRVADLKVQAVEYDAVKIACEFVVQHLNSATQK